MRAIQFDERSGKGIRYLGPQPKQVKIMENIQIRQKKIPDEVFQISEDYQTPSGSNVILKATRETKEILD